MYWPDLEQRLNKVSLADLTIGDLRILISIFANDPYRFRVDGREYDVLEKILMQVANRKGKKS
jgi:hypothetical protein